MAALAWRGDEETLAAAQELLERDDPRARAVGAYVLGQLGIPERTLPQAERGGARAPRGGRGGPRGAGHDRERVRQPRPAVRDSRRCCGCAAMPTPRVREGAADALAGRDDERVFDALVELTTDPEPGIRDWATFALGTLSPEDTPTLRDALAARLDDSDDSTRIEAVHGLALRGDTRALDAVLDLLGEVGPHDDGGNAADTIWKRYALTQATVRLAALTGDARLKEHLPALDERLMGPRSSPTSAPPTTAARSSTEARLGRGRLLVSSPPAERAGTPYVRDVSRRAYPRGSATSPVPRRLGAVVTGAAAARAWPAPASAAWTIGGVAGGRRPSRHRHAARRRAAVAERSDARTRELRRPGARQRPERRSAGQRAGSGERRWRRVSACVLARRACLGPAARGRRAAAGVRARRASSAGRPRRPPGSAWSASSSARCSRCARSSSSAAARTAGRSPSG